MIFRKRTVVAFFIIAAVGVSVSATTANPENDYTNLRILPKNISTKKLQHIMIDEFEDGLGVKCGFCHAEKKGSHSLDYSSDEKSEKGIARKMMQMTIGLNKKYFSLKRPMIGDSVLVITCITCHRGLPHPDLESIN